jgi:tripartite-type tricarboxylate transporter receptor subunit TctC
MPIDPLKDLLPVASLVSNALVLAANPALTAGKDFRGFVALARAARPPLFYASIGNGSEHHLAMELLKQQAGIDLTHVPYRGGGPAAIGVIGGDVAAMFGGGSVAPLILSGQLRGLAVSAARRTPLFPDLPAIAETYPGFEVTLWQGLFAPVGTPPEIVARLRAEASRVRVLPEVTERLAAAGAGEPLITTDAEFLARIRADYDKFGKVIRGIGARVE